MGDIPKSRDAVRPFLRQLLTPFYRTRMRKAQRRTEATRENLKANRAAAADVKELRRRGILK